MTKILLVDDDEGLCELLAEYLEGEGFEVTAVHDGEQAVVRAGEGGWDAVVLDVMLPGMNGFDVLKRIRLGLAAPVMSRDGRYAGTPGASVPVMSRDGRYAGTPGASVPVLMLTARDEDTDTVLGLELGADDYVAKPASPRVLVARLRALLRRAAVGTDEADGVTVGDLSVDEASRRVTVGGEEVALTGAEFNLLALLVRHAGHVVSREVLAEEGLGRPLQAYDRRIETHMAQIRRKLGPLPDGSPRIHTVRGAGYQYAR